MKSFNIEGIGDTILSIFFFFLGYVLDFKLFVYLFYFFVGVNIFINFILSFLIFIVTKKFNLKIILINESFSYPWFSWIINGIFAIFIAFFYTSPGVMMFLLFTIEFFCNEFKLSLIKR